MKIAVISDIHGFSLALERVLDDIAQEPGIDQIVVAGDLVESGPDPVGVVERLRSLDCVVLQGNTDRDLAAGTRTSALARWTMDQLGPERLGWLAGLPFSHRVHAPGSIDPMQDVLTVHANPFDMDRAILPDAGHHELRELIGDTPCAVLAFGHIHLAYQRTFERIQLLDVSAVGNSRDGDLASRWGLITWQDDRQNWQAALRKVAYPLAETEQQMKSCGMPNADKHVTTLRKATY